MDPILDEILRIRRGESVRPDVMRRWQAHIRETLYPQLQELADLRTEAARKGRKAKTEPAEVTG
jgi:hypothetical protein